MSARFLLPSPDLAADLAADLVQDAATGLFWPRQANPLGAPVTWAEGLAAVADMNRQGFLGFSDWRMPNRAELRSLIDHSARQPALPAGHPFRDVFLGWYWTSTSKAGQENYAWNAHFEGGRLFYSRKDEFRLLWPVRGESAVLPRTGQQGCFDGSGAAIACAGSGQDGELRRGLPWPAPRFAEAAVNGEEGVLDRFSGLVWLHPQRLDAGLLDWRGAQDFAAAQGEGWRLPDIRELESLVDAGRANPALPDELAALGSIAAEGFWSATQSGFDPAWAFVLYVQKGAVGVGFKAGREFPCWPVRGAVRGPLPGIAPSGVAWPLLP
jgi:hypothetical protein